MGVGSSCKFLVPVLVRVFMVAGPMKKQSQNRQTLGFYALNNNWQLTLGALFVEGFAVTGLFVEEPVVCFFCFQIHLPGMSLSNVCWSPCREQGVNRDVAQSANSPHKSTFFQGILHSIREKTFSF